MKTLPTILSGSLLAACIAVVLAPLRPALGEENWPRFRGPAGTGHSEVTDLMVEWGPENVVWKVELKGAGQSAPVNWGDRLFVTSASEDGKERYLFCLDRNNGELIWEDTLPCGSPETPHKMNSWATPTCATNGEYVVAFFGPGGLHCYNLEGEKQWSKELGTFPGSWGIAASPIILGNLVIQNCDAEGQSSLVALDLKTGEERWKTPRADMPKGGWSTPILIEAEGRPELILNGEFGVNAYDPETGKDLWFCEAFNGRGSPVPDYANGLLYVVNGKPGDLYTVKPGGSGDVTATHRKWHAERRGGRDLPAPAVVGDYLLVVSMSGIATCYDAHTGETLWTERLEGEFAGSPLVANGLVYLQTVAGGETYVIRPGKTLDIVSRNSLGADSQEQFRASLAPIGDKLYARSFSMLYCIGS